MNPILAFLRAFAVYACLIAALVLAVDSSLTGLAYPLAAAALAALLWCVVCVFKAVGHEPE